MGSTDTARRLHHGTFSNALAVVTGAGSGFGAATARALAQRGADVLLLDIDHEAAERQACEINRIGGRATSMLADIADRSMLEALALEIVSKHGPIDIVVNNPGIAVTGRFTDMTEADWARIRSINLGGVINGCAAFGTPMVRNASGHLVNVAPGLASTGQGARAAMETTRGAVVALSRSLRADWARYGVGVSAVDPGIRSGRRDHGGDRDHRKVAAAVCKAIARDRGMISVGWNARLTRASTRLTCSTTHEFAPAHTRVG